MESPLYYINTIKTSTPIRTNGIVITLFLFSMNFKITSYYGGGGGGGGGREREITDPFPLLYETDDERADLRTDSMCLFLLNLCR